MCACERARQVKTWTAFGGSTEKQSGRQDMRYCGVILPSQQITFKTYAATLFRDIWQGRRRNIALGCPASRDNPQTAIMNSPGIFLHKKKRIGFVKNVAWQDSATTKQCSPDPLLLCFETEQSIASSHALFHLLNAATLLACTRRTLLKQ